MEININTIEELKNHFSPKILTGKSLPDPKSVMDNTIYYLQASDGVYTEHIMFKGKWNKKVVDSNSNVILEEA